MAELTFSQLYSDLVQAATKPRNVPPDETFTVAQFARDCEKSESWAAAHLLRMYRAGEVERERVGTKHYYWFKTL